MAALPLLLLLFSLQSQYLASPISGRKYDVSVMKFTVHSVTHLDARGHYIYRHFDAGYDVDTLDLAVLNGLAYLVDVPREANKITAKVMESLNIPKGVTRVIVRTFNTERVLMYKKEYDKSFVVFSRDGARWLVKNTHIKLIRNRLLLCRMMMNLKKPIKNF